MINYAPDCICNQGFQQCCRKNLQILTNVELCSAAVFAMIIKIRMRSGMGRLRYGGNI